MAVQFISFVRFSSKPRTYSTVDSCDDFTWRMAALGADASVCLNRTSRQSASLLPRATRNEWRARMEAVAASLANCRSPHGQHHQGKAAASLVSRRWLEVGRYALSSLASAAMPGLVAASLANCRSPHRQHHQGKAAASLVSRRWLEVGRYALSSLSSAAMPGLVALARWGVHGRVWGCDKSR
jgi:hypothetical protein